MNHEGVWTENRTMIEQSHKESIVRVSESVFVSLTHILSVSLSVSLPSLRTLFFPSLFLNSPLGGLASADVCSLNCTP